MDIKRARRRVGLFAISLFFLLIRWRLAAPREDVA